MAIADTVFTLLMITLPLAVSALLHYLLANFRRKHCISENSAERDWDEMLIAILYRPLVWSTWLCGMYFMIRIGQQLFNSDSVTIDIVARIILILLAAWGGLRLVNGNSERLIRQKNAEQQQTLFGKRLDIDQTSIAAITKLFQAVIIVVAALLILPQIGVSISGLVTVGGIGGLIVGFASRELLANFFGGLMIYLERPFQVGDWIRSPEKAIEGTVEAIGWRLTRIRTFDKRPLYIPNTVFNTILLENASRMHFRRFKETIGVRYDDFEVVENIVMDVRTMLSKHPEINQEQLIMVHFVAFSSSSLDFIVYAFTNTTDWREFRDIQQDLLFRIGKIIHQHGAEIAFPTSTIHLIPEKFD